MFPYIGITDFKTVDQVRHMIAVFEANRLQSAIKADRKLMVGVMMSYKTLNHIPSKWAAVWPTSQEIGDIFIDHPLVLNALHYADFDGQTQALHLQTAAFYGGKHLHAIQLDMIWPDPDMIYEFLQGDPGFGIILQVNALALEKVGNDPASLIRQLRRYKGLVSVVLLDKSMGKGMGMDAEGLLPFARAIAGSDLGFGLAAAGGLGPDTLHLVEPLLREFPTLSIDAQGKLKPGGDPLQPTDWDLASAYLIKALAKVRG